MATNNFKLFDENKMNMLNDEEYATAIQRLGGVQTGVASSMLQNKFAYQVSLMAYAIAQMMNANGLDANDTAAVSTFVNNLSSTVLQKVIDKASTAEAQAGISTTKWMTPALVNAAVNALIATQAEAEAGISNAKVMSPLRVAQVNAPLIASLKTKRPNIIRTLPIAAGNTVVAGDVVDVVGGAVTKSGTPSQAIAIQSGSAGQSIDIIYSGVAELPGITAGTQVGGSGVCGYAPADGWLWVGPYWARPGKNLLDNAWFEYAENQRGQSNYSIEGTTAYTVDRFLLTGRASLSVGAQGCTVQFGVGSWSSFFQKIENPEMLRGKTITLTALCRWVSVNNVVLYIWDEAAGATISSGIIPGDNQWRYVTCTVTVPDIAHTAGQIWCAIGGDGGTVDIKAMKLELGSVSTLHLDTPPSPAEQELNRQVCKRYYRLWSDADGATYRQQALSQVGLMRLASPSLGTIVIGGTTCYYASADL